MNAQNEEVVVLLLTHPVESRAFSTSTFLVFGMSEDVYNCRMIGAEGNHKVIYPRTPDKADSLRTGCTGSHPGGF